MGFKEIIERLGEKRKQRKELLEQIDQRVRFQKIIEDRQLSSNERELNRFLNEEREEQVKEQLEYQRKKRDQDIKFGHNPINAKNIMKAEWEVLKEPNQFSKKSNLLANQTSVLRNNKKLLKTNKKLLKGGNMFKI
jgi:hypothetical protein